MNVLPCIIKNNKILSSEISLLILGQHMKYECIIFDCDGVLVDSEIIYHVIGSQELTSCGFPLSVARSIELFTGVSEQEWPMVVYNEYGKTISSNELESIIKKIGESLHRDLKMVHGVEKVMDRLVQINVNRCIVSNSTCEDIISALAITGLDRYFEQELVFDISRVTRGKPDPSIYLYAADQLGVDPKNCLVVEDSVIGIRAAKAAGMEVIGFLGGSHASGKFYVDNIINERPTDLASDSLELIEKILLKLYYA